MLPTLRPDIASQPHSGNSPEDAATWWSGLGVNQQGARDTGERLALFHLVSSEHDQQDWDVDIAPSSMPASAAALHSHNLIASDRSSNQQARRNILFELRSEESR
ncbi:hypothetical protein FHX48_001077 [Microbacterium halimionae]|uniref:Uncharacterized protein n=1 Tax=Microbacterium halimionae TaxID=1526413 RepID=A0A7W3JNG4_9MICO|nr:hypothetical protein [Microbacterium halimionae]MBA8816004.1 hypothetical protein [Microbacterium halimionae]NII96207.1 hypothetical protein [Microbacterium halimionae]